MTLTELDNCIAKRWQTILVLEEHDMDLLLDCVEKGGSVSSYLDDNGCVISIAPGNEYMLDVLLNKKIADGEVVSMYADGAFLAVALRMDEDWDRRESTDDRRSHEIE